MSRKWEAIQPPLFLGSERQKNWDVLDTGVYTDTLVAEGALKKNQQQPMAYPERARANRAAGDVTGVAARPNKKQERKEGTMNIQRKMIGMLVLAASVGVLAGCNKSDEKAAAPAASSAPAPAATTPAPTTPAPSATTPPATGATASVPAECEAYLAKVNACMDKLGSSNPAAASIKQQLESAKSQWAAIPDKTQLAAQCKQSSDLFAQSATQMGCP
ncbi:DUF5339 family protein [Achromobacter sp.]|uniref:DUF5339 family protein n=2 Tax=Alcaligenaceae TaxID=506 RepID=UPI002F9472BC